MMKVSFSARFGMSFAHYYVETTNYETAERVGRSQLMKDYPDYKSRFTGSVVVAELNVLKVDE